MAAYLILLLPALAMARIEVEVSGKFDGIHSNMGVYFSGNEVSIISDEERQTFGLDGDSLKDAVGSYFGRRPTDAYLRSPTPWGDLYKTYGWSQVMRTLVPKSARILHVTSEPLIVMNQIFENNSSKSASFNVGISKAVDNSFSSTWSRGGDLTVDQEISYKFNLDVASVRGFTSMSYTSSWGESAEKSQKATVGAMYTMELMLQPGQSVLAELQATKGTIKVEVEYEASLSGSVAVNYDDTYKGHRFWALDVQGVMKGGNFENKMASKQIIDIAFFSNATVIVHDRAMGYKIMEVSL